MAQTSKPDMATGPEMARDDGRDDGRYQQTRRLLPNEKYAISRGEMRRGMSYFWAAARVRGMPNPHFSDYWRAGWRPVEAREFPHHSGVNLDVDQSLIDMGIMSKVDPTGPIIKDDLMLMARPAELSQAADQEMQREATAQVEGWLQTLRGRSEAAVGRERTRIQRNYGPANEVPGDAEVEMG